RLDHKEPFADQRVRTGLYDGPRITKHFAQLTRANGSPGWIKGGAVSSIPATLPNEFVAGVNTAVFADGFMQGVKETPPDVADFG
ncbi:MAG TPA: hypothetical protein VGF62_05435, partial [Rhizomicrobium sp.]